MSPIGSCMSSKIFKRLFQYSGMWFPEKSISYLFYAFVLHSFFTLDLWAHSVVYVLESEDTADIIRAVYMLILISSLLLKSTTFLYFNKRIQVLLKELENFELQDENEEKLVHERHKSFLMPLIMFLIVTEICAAVFAIKSLIAVKPELPCPCFHPLDWKNETLSYWLAWVHTFLSIQLAIARNVGVQLFYSFLTFFISILMEVLGLRLSNLNQKTTLPDNCEYEQSLTDCIKIHKNLLK